MFLHKMDKVQLWKHAWYHPTLTILGKTTLPMLYFPNCWQENTNTTVKCYLLQYLKLGPLVDQSSLRLFTRLRVIMALRF